MLKTNSEISILEMWKEESYLFEASLKGLFEKNCFGNQVFKSIQKKELTMGSDLLRDAIQYSLFTGGKRFRPMLTYASCKALGQDFRYAIDWAIAVECIHTYSLIHDDLPSMDNDDQRRGLPTLHKKYDEATALLAGDALFTEAFSVLAKAYSKHANLAGLIQLLTSRSGFEGMVSGQANDLFFTRSNLEKSSKAHTKIPSQDQVLYIHLQKTAALINASCLGPFLIFDQKSELIEKFSHFGLILGILFQLKDDFLDADDKAENNIVQTVGASKAKDIYDKYKTQALSLMSNLPPTMHLKPFQDLIQYNDTRAL